MNQANFLARLLEPLVRRIEALLARGVVEGVNDASAMQGLKLTAEASQAPLDGVEHFQPYGFTSVPEDGAELLLASLRGHRGHAIALVVDDRRYRPTGGAVGEVTLYSKHGQRVHLKSDGSILITAGASSVEVTDDGVTVTGGTEVRLEASGSSIEIGAAGVTITSPGGTAEFT